MKRSSRIYGLVLSLFLALPALSEELPPLPVKVASFGAAVAGDSLYVYGGHVGRTHQHSVQNLSHRFFRLPLAAPTDGWQDLGEVKGLQGLPMVAWGDKVCRVGGLDALNNQDAEEEDLVSTDTVTCFDPESKAWQALPSLSLPRSSHDAVVFGDHLYVVGGWQLRGAGQEPHWHNTMEVLDLSASEPTWHAVEQPFERRALATAAADGKIYAFGGLGEGGTSQRVDVYDSATDSWSEGPELPPMAKRMKGFGVSAFGVGDTIYLSGADGIVHSLKAGAETWTTGLARLETPRFFHRLLPHGDHLLFVAGAGRGGHLGSVEILAMDSFVPGSVVPESEEPKAASQSSSQNAKAAWPGFRGRGDGHTEVKVPMHWSTEEGVAWRAKLPGFGQSAPVVWGQQVLVSSVEGPNKEALILSSFDLETGSVRWRRRFAAGQAIESSDMVSRGAPTPVVDGQRIYAFWESGDLVAVDHEGETLWHRALAKEYGEPEGNHGLASSPVLSENLVIVQVTHEGPSYFLAMDAATGENRWKSDRPSKVAWTTPVVVKGDGGPQIVSSAAGRVEALNARSGETLWSYEGIEKNHVPSVVVTGNLVVAASSDPGQSLALERAPESDSQERIAWRTEGVSSGFGSPLVQGGCALFVNKAGILSCVDLENGGERWQHRLPGAVWASPIAAGDSAFFFTKEGSTAVLHPTVEGPGEVAENPLKVEGTVYGVAAAPGAFLVRTGTELVRVGTQAAGEETVAAR